nr:MAG TPA: hypothetical protein [Caudoviricetes sp.]
MKEPTYRISCYICIRFKNGTSEPIRGQTKRYKKL